MFFKEVKCSPLVFEKRDGRMFPTRVKLALITHIHSHTHTYIYRKRKGSLPKMLKPKDEGRGWVAGRGGGG